jgi:sugar lactone lactonase YvrE
MNPMRKTLPDLKFVRAIVRTIIFAFFFIGCATAIADDYGDARAELVAAYQAQDYPAMRAAALKTLEARPGFAGAMFNLALAETLNDDADAALSVLNELLANKVDFGADELEEFASLHELPGWDTYTNAVAELYKPVGEATIAYQYDSPDFIPEGIAVGSDGELFLGGIRHGDIVRIADDSKPLIEAPEGSYWSVFGMRLAEDGLLWFASAAVPEFAGLEEADAGKTGLYARDTNSGEIAVRAPLPSTGNKQVLGDLIFDGDDTFFLADQADGIIYRYSIKSNEFSTLVDRGQLVSPQGLVFDQSGSSLYVADYVGGLYRVSLSTGDAERVTPHASTNDYGIDGLYRYKNKLIAIQNGIRPNRVVELELSEDGGAIIASKILAMNLPEFDDPNLGEIVGDDFLFIANSHWPKFDRDGNLPEELTGPIVLRIDLSD